MGLEVSHVLPVSRIPKTTSGKVQRHSLVSDYMDGAFSEVISNLAELSKTTAHDEPLELNDIEAALLAIGEQSITDKDISLQDNLFDVGISSLVLSEIHQQIDEHYPGLVDITDMFEYQSLAELAGFIQSKQ
jgi:acyl carrier protein